MTKTSLALALLAGFSLAACGEEPAIDANLPTGLDGDLFSGSLATMGDDAIRVVGSSTVYPFTTTVAEQFGASTDYATPFVESTGTGGGFKLFCEGVGADSADVTNASRPMKLSEFEQCADNGVTQIVEVPVGFDGIVVANAKTGPEVAMTSKHLFTGVAGKVPASDHDCTLIDNPYTNWNEIDPSLPDERIEVYGPPPTSGTRDAFVELGMELGALGYPCLAELHEADEDAFVAVAHTLREDGGWIDAGENDNAIVQTLTKTPTAFGVFGYSFLDQNSDRLRAATMDGVQPSFDNIASGAYPISRTLFVYVKAQNADVTPGLQEFAEEYASEDAMNDFGYLSEKGLIPLPPAKRMEVAELVSAMTPMGPPEE